MAAPGVSWITSSFSARPARRKRTHCSNAGCMKAPATHIRGRAPSIGVSSSATCTWSWSGSRISRRRGSPEVQRTGLWERWVNRANGGCPIGLVLRPGRKGFADRRFPPGRTCRNIFPPAFPSKSRATFPRTSRCCSIYPLRGRRGRRHRAFAGRSEDRADHGLHASPSGDRGLVPGAEFAGGRRASCRLSRGAKSCSTIHHQVESREIIDLRPRLPLRFLPIERRNKPGH